MFPRPKSVLVPNTYEFESGPMVKATGFREYDARWLFEKEIKMLGVQALGMGLGGLIGELGVGTVTASMIKYWATDMQAKVIDRCLQLFGGYGYMDE